MNDKFWPDFFARLKYGGSGSGHFAPEEAEMDPRPKYIKAGYYSSTKGAITTFTRSLATNLAEKNIRVNAVAPGPVWTPLIVSTFDEEKIRSFGKETAMKRAGQPSEPGQAYVFLASEDASCMTG